MSTKTIIFDLDNVLVESKFCLEKDTVSLLKSLLKNNYVAILTGASWKQVQKQVIEPLAGTELELLNNLYLLPSSGGSLYQVWSKYGWLPIWENFLQKSDIDIITRSIEKVKSNFQQPDKLWGKQVDIRESQITFSPLGQRAPTEEKASWDPALVKRRGYVQALIQDLPQDYEVRLGGFASVDITIRGLGKKYAIDRLIQHLHISRDDIIYVGSCIFDDGVGSVAQEIDLKSVVVANQEETKAWIKSALV